MTETEARKWDRSPFLLKVFLNDDKWYVQNGLMTARINIINYDIGTGNLYTRAFLTYNGEEIQSIEYATQKDAVFLKSQIDKKHHYLIKIYNKPNKLKLYLF